MKENTIAKQQVISGLKTIVKPWERLSGPNLLEQIRFLTPSIMELARASHTSVERVRENLPITFQVSNRNILVKDPSNTANIRIKKLIRDSVREPPIKGVRNGGKSLDEKVLARKVKQAQKERDLITFQELNPDDESRRKKERRESIHERIAVRQLMGEKRLTVNMQSPELKKLKSLVPVSQEKIRIIVEQLLEDPELFVFEFSNMLGLDDKTLGLIQANNQLLESIIPEERTRKIDRLKKTIDSLKTMNPLLSKERIHPTTSLEQNTPLFFGMGGGSRMPCQGFPLDVLKMVLTAEKLKRELDLVSCTVLGADEITYTNVGKTPDFTREKVDQIVGTEAALLNELFKRFGFSGWKAIRQSGLREHFPEEKVQEWENNIKEADSIDFVGGHHYAIEMADIQLQVPNGIKLGWFIRSLTVNTGYIMDEQPFHARFALLMALLGKRHGTTLLYTHAGTRLVPGDDGLIQKEAPYITYTPQNRLLLSPFEDVKRKLDWADARGGGLQIPFIREQLQAIVDLFEELVVTIPSGRIPENEILAYKLQFIINQGVGGDSRLQNMWKEAFPNSL